MTARIPYPNRKKGRIASLLILSLAALFPVISMGESACPGQLPPEGYRCFTLTGPPHCASATFPVSLGWLNDGCWTPFKLQIAGNPIYEGNYYTFTINTSPANATAWVTPLTSGMISGLTSVDGWYHWRVGNAGEYNWSESRAIRFQLPSYTLTVTNGGGGTVTSNPPGINCGSDCTESYPGNTYIALVATADPGFKFTHWSGDCTGVGECAGTIYGDVNVSAHFSIADLDGDGVSDASDNCPSISNSNQLNFDGDAEGDACDSDDDNDNIPDTLDDFPFNPSESVDTDGDGTGDNADTDDDNDGISDQDEIHLGTDPLKADTDGDGMPDGAEIAVGRNPTLNEAAAVFGPIYLLFTQP